MSEQTVWVVIPDIGSPESIRVYPFLMLKEAVEYYVWCATQMCGLPLTAYLDARQVLFDAAIYGGIYDVEVESE